MASRGELIQICDELEIEREGKMIVHHGFSNKKDLIESSLKRIELRKQSLNALHKQVKLLCDEQLLIDFSKKV